MRGTLVDSVWDPDPDLYAPAKYRRPCRYQAFVPDPLADAAIELPAGVAGVISDAERAIGSLNSGAEPALAPLARLLLRTESIASSKVEGLQVGVRDLARAEAGSGRRRTPQQTLEVLRNIDAMQLAMEEAAAGGGVGVQHITAIHRRLMVNTPLYREAGIVRTRQNWIGGNNYNPCGADFVPPPHAHVEPLLDDLCEAVEDQTLPPIVQAALVHAQFETIHPFGDGNGRTGRALIHAVLRRRGLATHYVPPISAVLAAERDRYIDGLTAFRDGEVGLWIEYFAAAATRAAGLATEYLQAVRALTDDWRSRLSEGGAPRSDAAAWAVIDLLPAHPVITAPLAEAATGRAKAAIHNALAQLVDCGVLIPLGDAKRGRAWEGDGLIELLERLEAGSPAG